MFYSLKYIISKNDILKFMIQILKKLWKKLSLELILKLKIKYNMNKILIITLTTFLISCNQGIVIDNGDWSGTINENSEEYYGNYR